MRTAAPRAGHTLVELLVALALLALLALAGVVGLARLADGAAVRAAGAELAALLGLAREIAVAEGVTVAVRLDAASGRATAHAGPDTLRAAALLAGHGVALAPSRDSTAFAPSGLGSGAANLSIVLTRGAAAETVVVSRLGRVRRSR